MTNRTVTFHDIEGRSVFITGGGAGIGAALTEGFVEQGANVAFVQRSDATAFCDGVEARHGVRPLFLRCDVTDVPALQAAMAAGKAAHGPYDVLVNNAAHDLRQTLAESDVAQWNDLMNVNLRPHYFAIQAAAEDMKARGGGAIVNFSSIAYMTGNAGFPIYAAAKAGITGLTRALARELGPHRIRVNALMPGWVLTERQMALWATPEDLAAHLARQCLPQHLQPRDIVDAALFLSSDASRMMTGQALVVDGGVAVTG